MLEPAFSSLPAGVPLVGSAILGAIVGSFLGAALERLPSGRSIVSGRSACDGCGKALTVVELVPVLSWLVQAGRCRTCGSRIGGWQLACELGGAGIGVASLPLARDGLALAAMLLGWQLLLLALLDLRHLWLPRLLVGWLAASGLLVAFARARVTDDAGVIGTALPGACWVMQCCG